MLDGGTTPGYCGIPHMLGGGKATGYYVIPLMLGGGKNSGYWLLLGTVSGSGYSIGTMLIANLLELQSIRAALYELSFIIITSLSLSSV